MAIHIQQKNRGVYNVTVIPTAVEYDGWIAGLF